MLHITFVATIVAVYIVHYSACC